MTSTLRSKIAAAFTAAFCLAPLASHAGLLEDDEARKAILDLRNRVEMLARDLNARIDNKADKTGALDLNSQNENLRQEIARLRGQVEVLANELANAQQRQKDFYTDLDARLRKLEPQAATIDGREALVQPGEQSAYDAALAQFKAGDYKGAAAAFNEFIRRFPQSGYAASAQYWIGNSHYALRDYRNAIAAQQAVVRNYPDSTKVPDALLNIASCQVELKDRAAARKTLDSVIARYPGTQAAETARERLATLK